jgi:ABC-type glycerol-3-phosphate transport system substrate-binding protein
MTQPRFLSLLTLAGALTLAACAQGNSAADLAPAAEPTAQTAAPAAPKGPMTPEQAKADCWMRYEEDKKIKNIDQRLALVEKCVDTTMRGQPIARPDR